MHTAQSAQAVTAVSVLFLEVRIKLNFTNLAEMARASRNGFLLSANNDKLLKTVIEISEKENYNSIDAYFVYLTTNSPILIRMNPFSN